MALKLIASYSKRLGLPAYSSHQFSVTIETELTGNDDVSEESARLYQTLQQSIDDQIRQQGFVPVEVGGNHGINGHSRNGGNGHHDNGNWLCSDKQKDLILKLIETHNLDKAEIESLARERFDKGVKQLNKLEASGLIDEMLERAGEKPTRGTNRRTRPVYRNGVGR